MLLALWGLEEQLQRSCPVEESWRERTLYLAHSPPVSRRDLFRPRRSASAAETAPADGHHPFRERLRLVRALSLLGPPAPEAAALPLRGFAMLQAASSCTACGACARICPTGALALAVDDEAYRLTFAAQACLGCEMCVHVCGPGALTSEPSPTYAEVFAGPAERTLQEGAVARCQRCRAPFPWATGSQFCAVCDYRRQHPFGSVLPADLQARPAVVTLREELS